MSLFAGIDIRARCCAEKLKELMVRCWNEDPMARPAFPAIVAALEALVAQHVHVYVRDHRELVVDPHVQRLQERHLRLDRLLDRIVPHHDPVVR